MGIDSPLTRPISPARTGPPPLPSWKSAPQARKISATNEIMTTHMRVLELRLNSSNIERNLVLCLIWTLAVARDPSPELHDGRVAVRGCLEPATGNPPQPRKAIRFATRSQAAGSVCRRATMIGSSGGKAPRVLSRPGSAFLGAAGLGAV